MKHKNEGINEFILRLLKKQNKGISQAVVDHFKVNRRTAVSYLQTLVAGGLIESDGRTKARTYRLCVLEDRAWPMSVTPQTEEDRVWRETIAPLMETQKENVRAICEYGFDEMMNNVIDHSESGDAYIRFRRDAASIEMLVIDSGVGIFEKIRKALNLNDPRESLIELSKGRFTTAPARHSGEGIFFTSRMFDEFSIDSRGLIYMAEPKKHDWLFEMKEKEEDQINGTSVRMEISTFSKRTPQSVFDEFSGPEAGFFKTHVSVALAKYDQEKLVSRSQARRVLARFEKFREVLLDFHGVDSIGQPFADEIFRVFKNNHPDIAITYVGTSPAVLKMIAWAQGGGGQGPLL